MAESAKKEGVKTDDEVVVVVLPPPPKPLLDLGGGTLRIENGIHILENVVVGPGKTLEYGNNGETIELRGKFETGKDSVVILGNGGGKVLGREGRTFKGSTIMENGPGFLEMWKGGAFGFLTRAKQPKPKKESSSSDEDDDEDGDDGGDREWTESQEEESSSDEDDDEDSTHKAGKRKREAVKKQGPKKKTKKE